MTKRNNSTRCGTTGVEKVGIHYDVFCIVDHVCCIEKSLNPLIRSKSGFFLHVTGRVIVPSISSGSPRFSVHGLLTALDLTSTVFQYEGLSLRPVVVLITTSFSKLQSWGTLGDQRRGDSNWLHADCGIREYGVAVRDYVTPSLPAIPHEPRTFSDVVGVQLRDNNNSAQRVTASKKKLMGLNLKELLQNSLLFYFT